MTFRRGRFVAALLLVLATPGLDSQTKLREMLVGHVGPGLLAFVYPQTAGLGDVNGDGRPDFGVLAVAHPQSTQPGLFLSVWSGHDFSELFRVAGLAPADQLLRLQIADAGDLDGDGASEVVVGYAWHDATSGLEHAEARVYRGAPGPFAGALVHAWSETLPAPALGQTGFATRVGGLGDQDGDGLPDVFVANTRLRTVEIRRGTTGALLRTLLEPAFGTGTFGQGVADAGDFNGDGVSDVAVGSPVSAASGPGRAYVFSGATGQLLASLTGQGFQFGIGVVSLGDQDGDGLGDLGVLDASRTVTPLSVHAGGSGALQRVMGSAQYGAVGTAADIDGDGRLEALLSAGPSGSLEIASGSSGAPLLLLPSGSLPPFNLASTGGSYQGPVGGGTPGYVGPGTPPLAPPLLPTLSPWTDITGDGWPEMVGSSGVPGGVGAVAVFSLVSLAQAQAVSLPAAQVTAPLLTATLPRLAATLTIELFSGPALMPGLLVLAPGPEVTTAFGTQLLHVDPALAGAWLLLPLHTSPAGYEARSLFLPLGQLLEGRQLTLQATFPGVAAGGSLLSSGLRLRLGF